MSDNPQASTGNGAAQSVSVPRKRIATASIDNGVGLITFADGRSLEVDPAKIPAGISGNVFAYGAISIVQTAYSNAKDPMAAGRTMRDRLYAGDWQPGPTRHKAEIDPLTAALAEHLEMPAEQVEALWLPVYVENRGFGSVGAARRHLRSHPKISAIAARITAERAKAAADSAKKSAAEDLTRV